MMKLALLLCLASCAFAQLPDPKRTPGAVNPDITQANIGKNICNPKWSTKSIRPSSSYTTRLKAEQLGQWGYKDQNLSHYEEDHLISLEIGGHPTDPKNLWPEPYKGPLGARQKDSVENRLHREVCKGTVTLRRAQDIIATDWVACYRDLKKGKDCR